ncbi:MAG: hypothetical protein N2442_10290 [Spirochaetes bacterium]|nr:hypothetical protein [Spirochaetota bacterium]
MNGPIGKTFVMIGLLCVLSFLPLTLDKGWAQVSTTETSGLPNQEGRTEEPSYPVRKVMVFFRTEGMGSEESTIFYDSLVIFLQGNPYNKRIVEGLPITGPDSLNERASVSFRRACDSWFLVQVKKQADAIEVSYQLYDIPYESYRAEAKYATEFPSARDRSTFFWKPIREALRELPPLPKDPVFTLRGIPGTRVFGLPGGVKELNAKGIATFAAPTPATYTFRAEKLGYEPFEQQVLLKEKGGDILLVQRRGTLLNLDFSLLNGQFPAFYMGFFPIPNTLFLKLGLTSFFSGIGPFLANDAKFEPFVSYPLMTVDLQMGGYLSSSDATVRVYVGAGVFLRVFYSDLRTMLDPVLPFGGYPLIGVEYAPKRGNSVFFEYTPRIILLDTQTKGSVPMESYLQTAFFKDSLISGTSVEELFWLELISFRLGYRVRL